MSIALYLSFICFDYKKIKEMAGHLGTNIIINIISIISFIIDFITFPIWYIIQRPWIERRLMEKKHAAQISSGKNEVTYRSLEREHPLCLEAKQKGIDTMDKMLDLLRQKYATKPCIATRKIVGMEHEKSPDTGKVWKKYNMGDYHWITYDQMFKRAIAFGRGIRDLEYPPGTKVVMYADTRADWLIAAHGCFKFNFTICTIYTNLGLDGIRHGISETAAPVVVVSQELLPKLIKVLPSVPNVKSIIVMEEPWNGALNPKELLLDENVNIYTYENIVKSGEQTSHQPTPPTKDDNAIIMYTSGSTGVPKGVVQTHENLTSAMLSVANYWAPVNEELKGQQTFIAFLPLAHVLEFLAENVCLFFGISIGYSTPNTLLDSSTMIKSGCKGDITLLRPTMMVGVPLIIDRIYKGVLANVEKGGPFTAKLFHFCVQYRLYWNSFGMDTPLINTLLFSKVAQMVGGRLKFLVTGSAPLAPVAQEFVRTVLGIQFSQGYGLTETIGTATSQDPHDFRTGNVGPPMIGVDIKLVSWEEGGYRVDDKCGPRGEVIIGGRHIAKEYYKLPQKTQEEFYDGPEGNRWFKTGDIGQFSEKGSLMIIDRKKDLVKPQGGEYISLGKVEGVLKLNPIVESICVVVRSDQIFSTAIIVPDSNNLVKFAEEKLGKRGFTAAQLCQDNSVKTALCNTLLTYGLSNGLEKFEIPKKIALVLDEWTPESGLVTAASKLKRKDVEKFYLSDIERMYGLEKSVMIK